MHRNERGMESERSMVSQRLAGSTGDVDGTSDGETKNEHISENVENFVVEQVGQSDLVGIHIYIYYIYCIHIYIASVGLVYLPTFTNNSQ